MDSARFLKLAMALQVACLFASVPVYAGEEDIYFSDLPMVASVSRLPQRLADAPTAVTVLDRAVIRASGARDLNDVFRLVPGFQTYPNNTDAARVTYHGLSDEDFSPRVQVLVDGRSLHSPLFRNGMNWALVPVALEDIERIEVVRGTNSASYGTNAFLGVINIITVDPSVVRGFSVSANHGNQGVRDYTLRQGGKLGEAGNFRFTYQQRDDDGLKDQFDWKDKFTSRLFDLRADFSLSERDVLEFSAGHVEAVTMRGRLARSGSVLTSGNSLGWPIHDFSQSSTYLQAGLRHTLSVNSDIYVRYAYVSDWASDRYLNQSATPAYNYDEAGDQGVRHEFEIQHNFVPLDKMRLAWGGSWRNDAVRSDTVFRGMSWVSRDVFRLFGNLEVKPINWFTGNLGLSTEQDSLAGFHTSPRVSANFHITPENTLRIGYSRAYRTGSAVDYRANWWDGSSLNFRGNRDLQAEQMDTWEMGYLGDWRGWRMSLDTRLFQEKIPNRMIQVQNEVEYMVEVQKIKIYGLEYQWKWQPFDATRIQVSQSFIHIDSEFLDSALAGPLSGLSSGPRTNLDQLGERSAPRYSNSILLMQTLPFGFEFSIAGYWLDKMKWTRNSWQDRYSRGDVRLAYPFRWGPRGGELSYTVQSFEGNHGEFKSYGQPSDRVVGRRHWLGLRLDF